MFALTGAVVNTGLIEVPMGLTLRQIVFDIGGGLSRGRRFKAVQTGGPSGGCLPEDLLDMPVDYETLAAAGSIMGSGRDDSHGRHGMHGRRCEVLHGLLPRRSRAVSACHAGSGTEEMYRLLDRISSGRAARSISTSWKSWPGW